MILGVDPQPSGAAACLCEGRAPIWPPPAIHDDGPSGAAQGATPVWSRLHAQLVRFLGDKELVRNVQIRVIEQPQQSQSWVSPEGFGAAKMVCAGRAALLAATQELDWDLGSVAQLRLVVVNETWVGVYAYRLSEQGVVSHAAAPMIIADTGSAFWLNEIAATIMARISEEPAGQADLGNLHAAAAEIGFRLTDAPTDDFAIAWKGVQNAKMSSVPVFTRRQCARWTSVRRLADELPRALAKVGEHFGGPSPILLAGVGAGWPFAAQIASAQGAVQTLADPAQALARGAAWWPERGEALFAGIADGVVAQAARETAVPTPERHGGVDLERLARLAGRSEHKT